MTKKLGQKFCHVEVLVDEFTVVFQNRDKETRAKWASDSDLYLLQVDEFVGELEEALKFELLGGLIPSTALTGYNLGFCTNDGNSSVRLAYDTNRPEQGICVRFGGRGLKSYMKVTNQTTSEIIKQIFELAEGLSWEAKFTRLDIAVDLLNSSYTVGYIDKKIEKGRWELRKRSKENYRGKTVAGKLSVSKSSRNTISNNGVMETAYYGSTLTTFLRVYDKRAEQLKKPDAIYKTKAENCETWLRFEAVFRKEHAQACAKHIADKLGTVEEYRVFLGLFVDRFNLFNVSSQDYVGWWKKITEGEVAGPPRIPKEDEDDWRDLSRSKEYFLRGDSGLKTLMKKIEHEAMRDGLKNPEEAVMDFLQELWQEHQSPENQDTAGVTAWKRRYDTNLNALNEKRNEEMS